MASNQLAALLNNNRGATRAVPQTNQPNLAVTTPTTNPQVNTPGWSANRPGTNSTLNPNFGGLGQTFNPTTANIPGLNLASTPDLGNLYNITYDENTIRDRLNTATRDAFAAQKEAYQDTENAFAGLTGSASRAQANSIRRAMASGVASGTDSSAAQLAAMTTFQEGIGTGATDLMNQRNQLAAQEQAAMSKNASDALNTSNQMGLSLGQLSTDQYGLDVQSNAALMQYLASIFATQTQGESSKYSADINRTNVLNQIRQALGYRTDPGGW